MKLFGPPTILTLRVARDNNEYGKNSYTKASARSLKKAARQEARRHIKAELAA